MAPSGIPEWSASSVLDKQGGFRLWSRQPRLTLWPKTTIKSPSSSASHHLQQVACCLMFAKWQIRLQARQPSGRRGTHKDFLLRVLCLHSRRETLPHTFPPTSQSELGHTASKDQSLAKRNEMSTNWLRWIMPPSQGWGGHCPA